MNGIGPCSRFEMNVILLRAFLRKDRNKALIANALLYAVGISLIALVVIPR